MEKTYQISASCPKIRTTIHSKYVLDIFNQKKIAHSKIILQGFKFVD